MAFLQARRLRAIAGKLTRSPPSLAQRWSPKLSHDLSVVIQAADHAFCALVDMHVIADLGQALLEGGGAHAWFLVICLFSDQVVILRVAAAQATALHHKQRTADCSSRSKALQASLAETDGLALAYSLIRPMRAEPLQCLQDTDRIYQAEPLKIPNGAQLMGRHPPVMPCAA